MNKPAPSTPVFSDEQRADLDSHLAEIVPDDARRRVAVEVLESMAGLCIISASEAKEVADALRAHYLEISKTARRLKKLLQEDVSLQYTIAVGPAPRPRLLDKWEAPFVMQQLHRLSAGAADVIPIATRGTPRDVHRDNLIAMIYSLYPPGAAKKTQGSHFEQTVEMVLQFVGRDIQNIHGLVLAALERTDPPALRFHPKYHN